MKFVDQFKIESLHAINNISENLMSKLRDLYGIQELSYSYKV
jgi:hypothetical protein